MKKILFLFYFIIIIFSIHCNTLNDIIDKTIRFNKWKEAKVQLEIYLKTNSTDSYAYSIYASVLNELKLYDDAILSVRKAINYEEKKNRKSELYFNLGNYYYSKKLKNNALQSYNESINLNKKIASPYYMIGVINYKNKEYNNALSNWKKYITLTDNSDKKTKLQEIINRFEQQLLEEKIRKEDEAKKREEFLKRLMNELSDDITQSKSLEEDKDKTTKSEEEFEEIDD